jgi:hypothetical protein
MKAFPKPQGPEDVRDLTAERRAKFCAYEHGMRISGIDVMEMRVERYSSRWRELRAHVAQGGAILDIGAGWVPRR